MDKTLAELVAFAHNGLPGSFPDEVVGHAHQRVVDTIGGAVGGLRAKVAGASRAVVTPVAEGGVRVWGTRLSGSPEDAAFANGVAVRYLDFNDTYRKLDGCHPSDNIPALLAAAEFSGANGHAFLRGVIASYEVQSRFADCVPFNSMGWDQPVAGVIGAAIGAATILGLTPDQIAHAISLAIVPNMAMHQTRCGELSEWKGCAGAMGGRQGLYAARLAAAGVEGPSQPFDGVNGVWAQVGKEYSLSGLGAHTWAIQQTNLKAWPVRDSCQLAVDTALDLRAQVRGAEISKLRIETYASAHKGAVADPELWAPRTRETADHSMLVSVALGLLEGGVWPRSFDDGRFLDGDVTGLIGRTEVDIVDEFDEQAPEVRNCRITANLADGRQAVAHGILTSADIERGKSRAATDQKFFELTEGSMSTQGAQALNRTLWAVDSLEDVSVIGVALADADQFSTTPADAKAAI